VNRDDIIRMAHEANFEGFGNGDWVCTTEEIERFATLVAEQEQKDCARVVMSFKNWSRVDLLPISEAIKSRRLDINREQA
jgi:hypothetical protein